MSGLTPTDVALYAISFILLVMCAILLWIVLPLALIARVILWFW